MKFADTHYTQKLKDEMQFFIHPKTGRVTYNAQCKKCARDCKQSFRAKIVHCSAYIKKTEVAPLPIKARQAVTRPTPPAVRPAQGVTQNVTRG